MGRTKRAYFAMLVLTSVMCFALWAGSGCSPSRKARVGVISQWEKKLGLKREHEERKVAGVAPRCLKDRANVEWMRQEVSRLEQGMGGQAAVFEKFRGENGDWIAQAPEVAACQDVPCIANQLYGSQSGLEGLNLYGFYLKTGYGLSLKRRVPNPSRGTILNMGAVEFRLAPFREFLFNSSELQLLWRLAVTLPDAYRGLATLQSIHHVPDAMYGSIEGWSTDTCGEAFTSADWGHLLLRSQCFETNDRTFEDFAPSVTRPRDDGIRGIFFLVAPHELSHVLDHATARDRADEVRVSETQAWLGLSGWYSDTVHFPSGSTTLRWNRSGGSDEFVRRRAGSISPSEDFAETAAWARYWPNAAAQVAPNKVAFISERFFDGRTYDSEGLSKYYVEKAASDVEKRLLEILVTCDQQADCITRSIDEGTVSSFESLRGTEWEACDHLDANESRLKEEVMARVRPRVERYLSERVARAPILRALGELRHSLETRVDSREAYLHCYRRPESKECYRDALSSAFDRVAGDSSLILGPLLNDERRAFLVANPYSVAEQGVRRFRSLFLSKARTPTVQAAVSRWQSCVEGDFSRAPAADSPLLDPFHGDEEHYVATPILNCINGAVDSDLTSVRNQHIRPLGVDLADSDARALIRESLQGVYLEALKEKLKVSSEEEARALVMRKPEVVSAVRADLLNDLSWVQNAGSQAAALSQCQPVGERLVESYLNRLEPGRRLQFRFASYRDVQSEWAWSACANTVTSAQVVQRINESGSRDWGRAMDVLKEAVQSRARDVITDCLARFANVRSAQQCLVDSRAWNAIELQSVLDWDQTSEGRSFASRRRDALQYLGSHRTELQGVAIAELRARRPSARR